MQSKFSCALLTALTVLLLTACGSKGESAAAPPDVKVVAGDSSATVSWTMAPGVEYWLFYAQSPSVTTSNWNNIGGRALMAVTSPLLIGGLVNGLTYSVTVNGRTNNGPGGPGSPSQSFVPRVSGTNWTVGPSLATTALNGVGYGATFVAVGDGGSLFTSTDASTWAAVLNPTAPASLNAVAYSTLGYVSVGAGGTIIYSADAASWAAQNSTVTNTLRSITTNGTSFIAVGDNGTILGSADGKNWTGIVSGTSNDLLSVSFGNSRYVAVGKNGTVLTSTDGTTWTTSSSNTSARLTGVTYGVNGTTATAVYVAVGDNGTLINSPDGVTWTVQTPIAANNFKAVNYVRQFVAVGEAGSIYTSLDGSTWTARTSGTSSNLNAIGSNGYGYAVVGAGGITLQSF